MRILAIDTSTKILSLGICDGNKIYEYNLEMGIRLSGLLIPTLKRIVDSLGWQMKDIDCFVCGLGPGSFTGVRLGLATIKGLALSLNKPVAGISSLDILAKNVKEENGFVIPIIDAKRNLVYNSIYKIKGGVLNRITAYMLLEEDEFLKKVKKKIAVKKGNNIVILGDAINLYKGKLLAELEGVKILDKDYWYPQGRNIIELAKEKIKNKELNTAFEIKPIYLYPKECQIRKSSALSYQPGL
jgi:tRNA threonylcarbamoyladenosine biosynthesis protein TsaB